MSEPKIAAKEGIQVELEEGTHYYCTCGHSKNQPFCDGAHSGTDFQPQPFDIKAKRKYILCQCKHTKAAPYCDGAHCGL